MGKKDIHHYSCMFVGIWMYISRYGHPPSAVHTDGRPALGVVCVDGRLRVCLHREGALSTFSTVAAQESISASVALQ